MKTNHKTKRNEKYGREKRFSGISDKSRGRGLPLGVNIAVFTNGTGLIIGYFFVLIGGVMFFVFSGFVSFDDARFSKRDPVMEGTLSDIVGTNSYENDIQVYKYVFEYRAPDGQIYTGESYRTGYLEIPDGKVRVKVSLEDPKVARIEGMKAGEFGIWVLLLAGIFPFVGLLMTYFGLKRAVNRYRILKYGKLAQGVFVRQEATNSSVNDQQVYKLYFSYTAEDGKQYTVYDKTHKTHKLLDEEKEWLVYNPDNPSEGVLLDALAPVVKRFFEKNKFR